jgi:hypothetical protein
LGVDPLESIAVIKHFHKISNDIVLVENQQDFDNRNFFHLGYQNPTNDFIKSVVGEFHLIETVGTPFEIAEQISKISDCHVHLKNNLYLSEIKNSTKSFLNKNFEVVDFRYDNMGTSYCSGDLRKEYKPTIEIFLKSRGIKNIKANPISSCFEDVGLTYSIGKSIFILKGFQGLLFQESISLNEIISVSNTVL